MTTSPSIVPELAKPLRLAFEVRWSCAVTRWTDHLNALSGQSGNHGFVHLVLAIKITDERRARVFAHVETPDSRTVLLDQANVHCMHSRDDELLHIDIRLEDQQIVSLTMDSDSRLHYARSDLLANAGMPHASYDPPVLQQRAAEKCASHH
mgnify:CR=1 FL=1